MKLGTVLSACNDNQKYYRFIPLFITYWRKYAPHARIVIVFIADVIPEPLVECTSCLHLVKPRKGLHTAFVAQTIRLFWPALVESSEAVMITDIDMLPVCDVSYLDAAIGDANDLDFMSVCPRAHKSRPCMCYNIAVPSVWGIVFGVACEEDVWNRLLEVSQMSPYDGHHGGQGWGLDERWLKISTDKYRRSRFSELEKIGFRRLSGPRRLDFSRLESSTYTDFHCFASSNRLTDADLAHLLRNASL